jgi:hypothetical protein
MSTHENRKTEEGDISEKEVRHLLRSTNVTNSTENHPYTTSDAESNESCCSGRSRARRWGILLLLLLALVASGTVLREYEREQARSMTCSNNLKQIGLALINYHQCNGVFPSACLCDKNGRPVNSWRTRLVPGYLSYNFPAAYDFAKSWDEPANAKLLPREARRYQFSCPSDGNQESAITNYVAVVGPNTMWPGCKPAKQAADHSDFDKILVIEVINSDILWMEPRDLTLDQALDAIQPKQGIGIGSRHGDGIHYVTVGGAVRTLDPNIDRESLRKLLVWDLPSP